jgi:hypothetical protein
LFPLEGWITSQTQSDHQCSRLVMSLLVAPVELMHRVELRSGASLRSVRDCCWLIAVGAEFSFMRASQQGTLKPDDALPCTGIVPCWSQAKWQIKIRTKAVRLARVVNTRAANNLDRADSRAAAGSRSPASSSRSQDAKAANRVAKAVRADSADCLRFGQLPRFGGFFWIDFYGMRVCAASE